MLKDPITAGPTSTGPISTGYGTPISVIVPIYHDASKLITAVCSALQQPAVAEVLLVDDGAAPHARSACLSLQKEFSRVRLVHYPVYGHDIASLLNLGISHARHDCIAFLYADGYFLPHRFARSVKLLSKHPEIDGVYEDVAKLAPGMGTEPDVICSVPPELKGSELFDALINEKLGAMDISGFLVRRRAIQRAGLFTEGAGDGESLAASMIKFSVTANVLSDSTGHPVAVRRSKRTPLVEPTPLLFARLIYWSEHQNVSHFYRGRLLAAYLKADLKRSSAVSTKEGWQSVYKLIRTAGRWPSVVRLSAFWGCLGQVGKSLLRFSPPPEKAPV